MFSFAGFTKKMNSFPFIFFLLVPRTVSFGRCYDVSLSICWMSEDGALERQEGNIWLNDTALKSIRNVGKVSSLTVYPAVEHKLTLQYGGSVHTWTVTITPRTKSVKVRGRQKPSAHPTNGTKGLLDLLSPAEVFACENGTLFFHQDDNFFLAIGHSMRLPVELSSRSNSMLLVSWVDNSPAAVIILHTVTLYHSELGSYNRLSTDTTTQNHYRFTALESCSPYVACVEIAGTQSFICLSALTDPGIPRYFEVTSWNSSSISLAWECPENHKYSSFLITAFYLNGTDHLTEEVPFWYKHSFVFTLSELQPCSRVKFGLQTVCQAGLGSRYSKMVMNEGNSDQANIEALHQISSGPNNYTLRWEVRNTSSISMFRVYHEGVLHGTTLITNYTVGGLRQCQKYQAKVEALCGESVLMNAKTITAQTGSCGVPELSYPLNNPPALWIPRTTQQPAVAHLYELSLENGTVIQSNCVTDTEFHLQGLEEGKTYILNVWENCETKLESEHSYLLIEGTNASFVRAAEPNQELDFSSSALTMILPWSLPDGLQDDASEPRLKMETVLKDKLQELLKDFKEPARVELVTVLPADVPDKTEIQFMSFDASVTNDDTPLPVAEQLHYISSLNVANITVANGVIHWDGPDLCASFRCPINSLCINTLGSYTCECIHGYYDVNSVLEPAVASHPACNEKGLFSQCLDKLITGGIAKPYLTSYMSGKVDVKLNDGRCIMDETDMFYHFHTSPKLSDCGTEKRVNKSHIEFQNTLSVTLTKDQPITRHGLKVVWKCVYPRHYVRHAKVNVDIQWFVSSSLVVMNSSLQLVLSMKLYTDDSYTSEYKNTMVLGLKDTLFFHVALQTNSSFASDVLLQVESCWATEGADPQDTVQGVFLQDGCPVDNTFHWLSVNGLAQSSRFSIQMFTMPKELPLYFHCLANICGRDENCAKDCTSQQRTKRTVSQGKRAAVVSAGPLLVNTRMKSGVQQMFWAEHMTIISIVAGSIGLLGLIVLAVSATKAMMTYYERLLQQ
ncbi:Pancreatic secretory granule membrane major glycoprotein GP2 [Channa argus]|uniref:Pancreatic secretory granule membrane major glycoprotein GP2 n=1 Tax=Channa argus TaxID=215402 RepID=A0A6G1QRF8_CHAAH|nr:Pancreatic secretory granule membrane major glycoprotein GP2 [Channa argus]